MKRRGAWFSLLAVAALFAACAGGPIWFEGTFDEALEEAAAESKMVLIDFYSPT